MNRSELTLFAKDDLFGREGVSWDITNNPLSLLMCLLLAWFIVKQIRDS